MLPNKSPRRGFTLIELLVVISIIAILVALLLPALSVARQNAMQVACLSNQRQIGIALYAHLNDFDGQMPEHTTWPNLMGNVGKIGDPYYQSWLDEPNERSLNRYLTDYAAARCPGDLGDTYGGAVVENCYEFYGNSYQVQFSRNSWRTQNITGRPGATNNTPFSTDRPAAHLQDFPKTKNKIVLGDWNWHGNRPVSHPRTIWHLPTNSSRQFNMLFLDGHSEFFAFPDEIENWGLFPPPDPGYLWW